MHGNVAALFPWLLAIPILNPLLKPLAVHARQKPSLGLQEFNEAV